MEQDYNRDQLNDRFRGEYGSRRPVRDPSLELARVSMAIAIISMLSYFVMPILLPLSMAPIAFLVGIISRGNKDRFRRPAVIGISVSGFTIAVNLLILFTVAYVYYKMQTDPAARAQFNQMALQLYGVSLDEVLGQIISGLQ